MASKTSAGVFDVMILLGLLGFVVLNQIESNGGGCNENVMGDRTVGGFG